MTKTLPGTESHLRDAGREDGADRTLDIEVWRYS